MKVPIYRRTWVPCWWPFRWPAKRVLVGEHTYDGQLMGVPGWSLKELTSMSEDDESKT